MDREPTFEELRQSVERTTQFAILRWKWFEEVEESIAKYPELVDPVSGTFFSTFRGLLLDSLILDLSRLTDPARQGKHVNLSIETLLQVLPREFEPEVRRGLGERANRLATLVSVARKHRDKRVAHKDLQAALSLSVEGIRKDDVRGALELLAEMLNEIRRRMGNATTHFFSIHVLDGGLDSVIWHLLHGVRRIAERRAASLDVQDVLRVARRDPDEH